MKDDRTTTSPIKKTELAVLCLILACLFVFPALFFALPKKDFSENENRYLEKTPVVSFANLKSGKLTEDTESYLSDHFPARDFWLALYSKAARLSGRREINGVYLTGDNALIDVYEEPKNTARTKDAFSRAATGINGADVYIMLVPTAVSIYNDTLPSNSYDKRNPLRQQDVIGEIYAAVSANEINFIDAEYFLRAAASDVNTDTAHDINADDAPAGKELNLTHGDTAANKPQLYYKGDHHWTTYGAYVGYEAFCESAGLDPVPLNDYEAETVSDSFYGTTWSKLCDPYFKADEIVLYTYPDWDISVVYEDTGEITDTPYNLEYLNQKDKYSLFLNNLHPLVTIVNNRLTDETDADGNGGSIAIIKDSYANSMIPYLINHYHTLYIFDTRYYTDSVIDFINEHDDIRDTLILYNLGTMDNDTGIGAIY